MTKSKLRNNIIWTYLIVGLVLTLVLSVIATYFWDTVAGLFAGHFLPILLQVIGANALIFILAHKLKLRQRFKKIAPKRKRVAIKIVTALGFAYVVLFIMVSADQTMTMVKYYGFLYGVSYP